MRRAIRLGSVEVALLAAGELNHVDLDDALGLCLLLRGDRRYEVAVRRWLVRFLTEHRDASLAEVAHAADAFDASADPTVTAQEPVEVLEALAAALRRAS